MYLKGVYPVCFYNSSLQKEMKKEEDSLPCTQQSQPQQRVLTRTGQKLAQDKQLSTLHLEIHDLLRH